MALKVDIEAQKPAEAEADIMEIIENVCDQCTLGYNENLYVGVHLTGDEGIKKINSEFRNLDKSTDVLSFPLLTAVNGEIEYTELDRDSSTGLVMLGDIVVSTEKAQLQADTYGHSLNREIAFLICHGMLHILGYDHEDEDDEKLMLSKQKDLLEELRYTK
ncbi:MAG: rRNA maturation RNase YbeY [Clostridiales bacterium]|nr:rRNA maturation RNase YbeY [Clostridiales bacterium]